VIALPRLYAIIDVDVCARAGWTPLDLARAYLDGGARLLQLRAKNLAGGAFVDLADRVLESARGAVVIINDRADIAAVSGAGGVHVGQDDLSPADVRLVAGEKIIVGYSTHDSHQIEQALREPISYFAVGPVFGTATKATGYEPVGCDAVRHAALRGGSANMPVVAIGGITLQTAPRVIEAGAAAVAVITDLLTADPAGRVGEYLSALE
jgi:thiamine-phosphate pyrophosphorylase